MARKRDHEESSYLQEEGLSIRKRRTVKAKPPRGSIPMVLIEGDWDGQVEPLMAAHGAVLARIDSLFAEPNYARLQALKQAGGELAAEPELLALATALEVARIERLRIEHALAPYWGNAPVIGNIPVIVQAQAHPWTMLAMQLLVARYTGSAVAKVVGLADEAEQREIVRHFRRFFGVRVSDAWALAVVAEVHRAALEQQNADIRRTSLDDKQLRNFAASDPPSEPSAHAGVALRRSIDAMSNWAIRFDLPSWLDAPLLAYFIGRYGFERGGGAGRKISRATLLKLLTNPTALTKDLKKSRVVQKAFATNLAALRRRETITAHAVAHR